MAEDPRWLLAEEPMTAAATALVPFLESTIERTGAARLAIAGGSAVRAVGRVREDLGAAWSRVALTWVDERCVAPESADSNRGEAHRSGALDAALPPAVELPLFERNESPELALERIERGFAERFGGALDANLLGMGPDGHIASLFPGRAWEGSPGAHAIYVDDSPKPPPKRISLTRSTLASAGRSVLVAAGAEKRSALERLARGDAALPATGLPGLVIVTDQQIENAPFWSGEP